MDLKKMFALVLFFVGVMSSGVFACDNITIEDVRKRVGMAFPIYETAEIIERERIDKLCAIFVNNQTHVLPVFMGDEIAIVGTLLKNGDNYTQKKVVEFNKKILQEKNKYAEFDEYIAITLNSAKSNDEKKKVIYFFTDPLCPYCNNIKKQLPLFAKENNVEIRVIFYAISPQSEEKVIQAYCSKMTYDDYLKDKYPKCDKSKYEDIRQKVLGKLRSDIFIQGVPIFFNANKEMQEGANISKLKELLK